MTEKPSSDYFDLVAPFYEEATGREGAWTPPQMIERYALPVVFPGMRVLDIGIGSGQSSSFLSGSADSVEICGIDVSAKMLGCAAKNFRHMNYFWERLIILLRKVRGSST